MTEQHEGEREAWASEAFAQILANLDHIEREWVAGSPFLHNTVYGIRNRVERLAALRAPLPVEERERDEFDEPSPRTLREVLTRVHEGTMTVDFACAYLAALRPVPPEQQEAECNDCGGWGEYPWGEDFKPCPTCAPTPEVQHPTEGEG